MILGVWALSLGIRVWGRVWGLEDFGLRAVGFGFRVVCMSGL